MSIYLPTVTEYCRNLPNLRPLRREKDGFNHRRRRWVQTFSPDSTVQTFLTIQKQLLSRSYPYVSAKDVAVANLRIRIRARLVG